MSKRKGDKNSIFLPKHEDYMFWDSANNNAMSAHFYLLRLIELGISMFEWKNLPDSIDWRFIEYMLFYNGQVLYSHDDELSKDIVTQVALSGKLDFYRVPKDRIAYAENGYNRHLTDKNSVVIWNSVMRMPSYYAMVFYAKKLYNIDVTIDININAQKTPIMILADEDERLTLKNVYQQYEGNQPFIFGTKNLGLQDRVAALKTDAPYLADKLYDLKKAIWKEALEYLGVYTASDKRERMLKSESMQNQGSIIASRQSRLEMRREAVEKINKMFGTNIEVNYRDINNDIETIGEPDLTNEGVQI